jgi:hypothetical protein
MVDTHYIEVTSVDIGTSVGSKTTISTIVVSFSDKLVPSKGDLVEPVSAIDDKVPTSVAHRHRNWEMELKTDGWNYEALMTQVVDGGTGKALMQGADNAAIGYFVATLKKIGGSDTVTFQSGKVYLTGFSLKVSNKKGTKHQECVQKFICIGTRT